MELESKMHITVQIVHEITARLKHTKNTADYRVFSQELCELSEIDDIDAPLVASGIIRKDTASESGGLLRNFNGDFWYSDGGSNQSSTQLQAIHASKAGNDNPFWKKEAAAKPLRRFSDDLFKSVEKTNIDEARRSFLNNIEANVMAVDGLIYTRVPEPHIIVAFLDNKKIPQIIFHPSEAPTHYEVHEPKHDRDYGPKVIDIIRLDKIDLLDQHKGRNFTKVQLPTIHSKGLFHFDDEEISLIHNSQKLQTIGQFHLPRFPYEAGVAWFKLGKAFDNAIADFNTETCEALAEAVALYRDALEQNGFRGLTEERDSAIARANAITSRWQTRPIDLGLNNHI